MPDGGFYQNGRNSVRRDTAHLNWKINLVAMDAGKEVVVGVSLSVEQISVCRWLETMLALNQRQGYKYADGFETVCGELFVVKQLRLSCKTYILCFELILAQVC